MIHILLEVKSCNFIYTYHDMSISANFIQNLSISSWTSAGPKILGETKLLSVGGKYNCKRPKHTVVVPCIMGLVALANQYHRVQNRSEQYIS